MKLFSVLYLAVTIVVASIFVSCHALVVADKLYYQGTVGKSVPALDVPQDTLIKHVYD